MRSITLILVVTVTGLAASAGENWPQFRGPGGDGQSDATGLPVTWSETENVKWKTPIHDRGWSSPVVFGDRIWMTTATKEGQEMFVVCVDLETGKILHDVLLFDDHEPEPINALNSYASPTPAVEAGRVYVHFGTYGTACLDTVTGKTLWTRRDLRCNHFRGPGSSPLLFGDLLYLHYDGFDVQYVVALDKRTGKTVWRTDRSTDFGRTGGDFRKAFCTPIVVEIGGRLQLISPGSKAAMAYDPRTGRELWKVRYGIGFSTTSRPLFTHGLVLINTGFGRPELWAVRSDGHGDVTDSHVEWKVTKGVPFKSSPVIVRDLIYMVNDSGIVSCVESTTGQLVWQKRIGGEYSASPIYADGRVYFFSHEDKATVIGPGRRFKLLAANKLDEGFMASPAVVGKALILRTKTHLYRIEKD